ncbi:MAG: hypothetical protein ABJB98_04065 [Actinomycetota bacterium]
MRSTSATVVDAVVWPDETAGFLAQCPPGADAVVAQSVMEPERLSDAGQIDALVAIERQQSWLAARQQQLLAAMATDDPSGSVGRRRNCLRAAARADHRAGSAVGLWLELRDEALDVDSVGLDVLRGGVLGAFEQRPAK